MIALAARSVSNQMEVHFFLLFRVLLELVYFLLVIFVQHLPIVEQTQHVFFKTFLGNSFSIQRQKILLVRLVIFLEIA